MLTTSPHLFSSNKHAQAFDKDVKHFVADANKLVRDSRDFQIYRLEDLVNNIVSDALPCREKSIWIMAIKKGSGEKKIGQRSFSFGDSSLFIVPSRTIHSTKYYPGVSSGYVVSFKIDFLLDCAISKKCLSNRKVLKSDVTPFLQLEKDELKATSLLFEDLLSINSGKDACGHEMLAVKLLELLIYFDQLITSPLGSENSHENNPLLEKFTELLGKKYHMERGVQYYADALNVHPNYLNFLLKKYTGTNAKESIDQRLIMESKYLLINRSLRIKEIAHKLGFDDPNNFSTFFQRYSGNSPVMYRNLIS